MKPAPTLADVQDELRRGGVLEAEIRNPDWHLDGYCDGSGVVVVNPHLGAVVTAIHELLHRRFPRWKEKRVQAETRRLVSRMSDQDVAAFYQAYKRQARKLRKPVTIQTAELAAD